MRAEGSLIDQEMRHFKQFFFFILNIFIVLRYTYTTPVVTGSKNQGLGEEDRTPPVGYGHLGIQMPVLMMNMQVTNSY